MLRWDPEEINRDVGKRRMPCVTPPEDITRVIEKIMASSELLPTHMTLPATLTRFCSHPQRDRRSRSGCRSSWRPASSCGTSSTRATCPSRSSSRRARSGRSAPSWWRQNVRGTRVSKFCARVIGITRNNGGFIRLGCVWVGCSKSGLGRG